MQPPITQAAILMVPANDDSNPGLPPAQNANPGKVFNSERHPYHPPGVGEPDLSVTQFSKDQSIEAEPWLKQGFFRPDPTDSVHSYQLQQAADLEQLAENSIWDEPTTSPILAGAPEPYSVTWFGYYLMQVAQTPLSLTWLVTLLIVIASGPLAILGTLFTGSGRNAWLMYVVMGPTIEEILKIAVPLWIIEKKPWLFSNSLQILLCAAGAGLVFATIENLIYLFIYVPNPSDLLVLWRWTVCVALHTGCSIVAAFGLIAIRQGMIEKSARPQLTDGSRWIVAAIVIHGTYNFMAILINDWF